MKKVKKQLKQFIIRKYVMAFSGTDAIKRESKVKVDEVFIDDEWRKNNPTVAQNDIGFNTKK